MEIREGRVIIGEKIRNDYNEKNTNNNSKEMFLGIN